MNITQKFISHNFDKGRGGKKPIQITLHTAVSNATSLYDFFNNPNTQASTHFYVNKDGVIEQYVHEEDTAYSNSNLNANHQAITSETWDGGNANDSVRTDALYEGAAQLVANLAKRYSIPLVLLTKEQALANQSGLTLHKYYTNKSCPGALDINRIIARALIINGSTPTNSMGLAHIKNSFTVKKDTYVYKDTNSVDPNISGLRDGHGNLVTIPTGTEFNLETLGTVISTPVNGNPVWRNDIMWHFADNNPIPNPMFIPEDGITYIYAGTPVPVPTFAKDAHLDPTTQLIKLTY